MCEGVKLQYRMDLHGNSLTAMEVLVLWKEILINWDCQLDLKYRRAASDYDRSGLNMILEWSLALLWWGFNEPEMIYSWMDGWMVAVGAGSEAV